MSEEKTKCPMCEAYDIHSIIKTEVFEYGIGLEAVTLNADVYLHTCKQCDFEFTDEPAETKRHEAVCKYLHILPPNEIIALRVCLSMSRPDLSKLTGIGEASIGRWERGELFQTKAFDNLLRLLFYPENIHRLRILRKTNNATLA